MVADARRREGSPRVVETVDLQALLTGFGDLGEHLEDVLGVGSGALKV